MSRIWTSQDLEQMLEPKDWLRLQQQVRSRVMSQLKPIPTEVKSRLYPLDEVRAVLFDIYGTLLVSDTGELLVSPETQASGQSGKVGGQGTSDRLDSQALRCLPKLLRASLPENFAPSRELKEGILQHHQQSKSPSLQYPEVDIVAIWHQIFLQQLNKDMHSSLSPFILARFAIEYEMWHNRVQLMPGAVELLYWLAARNFYIGIISNAQFYTPVILCALLNLRDLADLNILPEICFWSYRQACSKPQSQLFESASKALARHDLTPQETLYLGNDMRNDIWGAKQASFRTALFAGDQQSLRLRHDMPELANIEPDIVITELGQLKSVL